MVGKLGKVGPVMVGKVGSEPSAEHSSTQATTVQRPLIGSWWSKEMYPTASCDKIPMYPLAKSLQTDTNVGIDDLPVFLGLHRCSYLFTGHARCPHLPPIFTPEITEPGTQVSCYVS